MAASKEMLDWKNNELNPKIYEELDIVFPNLHFKKCGKEWQSAYRLNGEETERKDRTISRAINLNLFSNGESGVRIGGRDNAIDYISYYEYINKCDFITTVENLAKLLKLQVPEGMMSKEEVRRYKEEMKEKQSIQESLVKTLFSDEGRVGLEYLRNKRKFTDEQIKEAGFGWYCEKNAGILEKRLGEGYRSYFGRVTIPFKVNGAILSYQYRRIDDETNRKYLFERGFSKSKYLESINRVELIEATEGIIIVEGLMDEISARIKGKIDCIVSSGGNELSDEQIEQLIKYKVKSVYLLYDSDETKDEAHGKRNREKIYKAAQRLENEGLTVYISKTPKGYNDIDEYLQNPENDPKTLEKEIRKGLKFRYWELDQIITESIEASQAGMESEAIEVFMNRIYNLYQKSNILDKKWILQRASETFEGVIITEDSLRELYQQREAKENEKRRQAIINGTIKKAESEIAANPDTALETLKKGIEEADKLKANTIGYKYLLPRTKEEREASYAKKANGIPTQFLFGTSKSNREELYLPSDALTLIGGKTSHGKSRLMMNLALDMAYNNAIQGTQGRILYFCFEESADTIEQKLLNNFCGISLNAKGNLNKRCIEDYFRYSNPDDRKWKINSDNYQKFEEKKNDFYKYYIDCGRLQVINDGNNDIFDIISTIEYLHSKLEGGIKAVFIDYIQLLSVKGFNGRDDIKYKIIVEGLNALANKQRIPIILGTQLKNSVNNIGKLDIENASESSDIGKCADTAIFIWDSKQPCVNSDEWTETTPRRLSLLNNGFDAGSEENHLLYMQLVKCRNGVRNSYCVAQIDAQFWRVIPLGYWDKNETPTEIKKYGEVVDFSDIRKRNK